MPPRRPLTRRDVDVRLGYTGLGIGALSFVLVLVASFVVIEVGPRIDLPDVLARQSIVRYPALESVPVSDRDDRTPGNTTTAERSRPDRPAGDAGVVIPEPDESGGPDEDDTVADGGRGNDGGNGGGNGGGGTPGDPDAPVADGPVSQAVDPAVTDLTGALDAATGGATSPVTGPAGELTDDVSDLGDALLGRP